jgi:hypothetical protein
LLGNLSSRAFCRRLSISKYWALWFQGSWRMYLHIENKNRSVYSFQYKINGLKHIFIKESIKSHNLCKSPPTQAQNNTHACMVVEPDIKFWRQATLNCIHFLKCNLVDILSVLIPFYLYFSLDMFYQFTDLNSFLEHRRMLIWWIKTTCVFLLGGEKLLQSVHVGNSTVYFPKSHSNMKSWKS